MPKHARAAIFSAILVLSIVAEGAEVSGTVLYDDVLVTSVFPDIKQVIAAAYPSSGGAEIYGTVDLATSTYRIEGLAVEGYRVNVRLLRTDPSPWVGYPGDLGGSADIEPTDPSDVIDQDIDIRYLYHIVSPIDSLSQLDGLRYDCTGHPAVPYPISFAIAAVPRATDYNLQATLLTCPSSVVGYINRDTVDPFVVIDWGTLGEDFQTLAVTCTGTSGKQLCALPSIRYSDGVVNRLALTRDDSNVRGVHRSDAVVIPAVAGTPGSQGTYWSSAVSVVNLATTDREIEVLYTPRGANGLTTYSSETVSVPASSQVSWSDIVTELFSTTGAGALEFRGLQLAVTSRTSTPGEESGSYGQGIPPVQPEQVLSSAGAASATMGGVEEGTVFRSNLGLCETWGENATVTISIMDSSMTVLGSRDYELRPYENTQINQVAVAVAGANPLSEGIVRVAVTSGNGRIAAYLSVVDNTTGDPTFIAIAPQSPSGG